MPARPIAARDNGDEMWEILNIDVGNMDFSSYVLSFGEDERTETLPFVAASRLMANGAGFAGEGDWKTAALVRAMKVMGYGLKGGNSFMEDYTYHFDPANPLVLGSHMLEICPSIASGKPSCEIHPLGIGGKAGDAVLAAADGRVVFVPYAIAGEQVGVEIEEVRKDFARARLVEIRIDAHHFAS